METCGCCHFKNVEGWDKDKSLFLMDTKRLNTQLPVFYKNLLKVWNLFNVKIFGQATSLSWLLKEPLIYGTRFVFTSSDNAISDA